MRLNKLLSAFFRKRKFIKVASLGFFIVALFLLYSSTTTIFISSTQTWFNSWLKHYTQPNVLSFEEKHPEDSRYANEIRVLFEMMQDYSVSNNSLVKSLFDHHYSPFQDFFNFKTLAAVDSAEPYDLNPNLYWDVLLSQVLESQDEVEFAWYDFIDNIEYNTLLRLSNTTSVTCKTTNFKSIPVELVSLNGSPGLFVADLLPQYSSQVFLEKNRNARYSPQQYCLDNHDRLGEDFNSSRDSLQNVDNFLFPLRQFRLNHNVRGEVYGLQSTSHLIDSRSNPLGIIMLSLNSNHESRFKFYSVRQEDKIEMGRNFVTLGLVSKLRSNITLQQDELLNKWNKVPFESLNASSYQEDHLIDRSLFQFNIVDRIKELEEAEASGFLNHVQMNYLSSLRFYNLQHYTQTKKHFQEPTGIIQFNGRGFHYDAFFFHSPKFELNPQLKQASIHGLLHTLITLVNAYGLHGWIAHGNLLAWSFNGINFPWDDDVDYQMPIQDLHTLAEFCNQTLVLQDPHYGNGRYWLDFGNLVGRNKGNGKNNIDARLIDVDSGLFIDITGMSFNSEVIADRDYELLREFVTDNKELLYSIAADSSMTEASISTIDHISPEDYIKVIQSDDSTPRAQRAEMVKLCKYTIEKEAIDRSSIWKQVHLATDGSEESEVNNIIHTYLNDMTAAQRFAVNKHLGLVSCRNRHFTLIDELSIQKSTFVQRIPSNVPQQYLPVLKKEYREIEDTKHPFDSLIQYKTHIFLPSLQMWLEKKAVLNALKYPHKLDEAGSFSLPNGVDLSKENIESLDLETTELLLGNMCDLNNEEFNQILVLSDMIEQNDQREYRAKELSLEIKGDGKTDKLYASGLPSDNLFHIDPYVLNILYRQYYNNEKPYNKNECLHQMFKLVKKIENKYFDEE